MRNKLYLVAVFALLSVPLAAQAPPAAGAGTGISLWIGGSLSTFNPDYGCESASPFSCADHQLIGVGPYVDTNLFLFGIVGFEGEARLMLWHGPGTLIENSYLGGPRFRLFRYKDLHFAGKFLLGQGHMDVPDHLLGGGNYFAYAPGVAMDFPVARHIAGRFEYEYQRWPGWASFHGHSVGGLTPNGFSFGISYKIPSLVSGKTPN